MEKAIKRISVVLMVIAMAGLSGCASKSKKAEQSDTAPAVDADVNLMGDSDSGKAAGLQTINFAYDAYALSDETRRKLNANAQILREQSNLNIQVEGHCDSRGGIQYNIALGEKRANAVRKYLIDLGIAGNRITTISFGKERPLDPAENETAWAMNRRANFVITSR